MTDANLIYLTNARLSFPSLIDPQRTTDPKTGKERISYNCDLLLTPTDPGYAKFWQVVQTLALEKWKEHAQAILGMILPDRKQRCFGQGEERKNSKTFQTLDGYVGMVYISCGNKQRPQMILPDGRPVPVDNSAQALDVARRLYAGCRVNAAVKPWMQDNAADRGGRGVRCDLIAIQFLRDDAPFGAGNVNVEGVFGQVQPPPGGAPTAAGASLPPFMAQQQAAPTAPAMPLPPFMQNG